VMALQTHKLVPRRLVTDTSNEQQREAGAGGGGGGEENGGWVVNPRVAC
jgi:hypothetical protein